LKNFVSRNLVESERREQLDAVIIRIVDYNRLVIDMICRLKQLVQQCSILNYHLRKVATLKLNQIKKIKKIL